MLRKILMLREIIVLIIIPIHILKLKISGCDTTSTRSLGTTRGKGGDALTYGLRDQKVKAAVKKGSTQRRGRRKRW
jgi:hypothetical protein